MFQLSAIVPNDLDGGINLIDIGASGGIPAYWKPLSHLTNFIGFDPNEQECLRLNSLQSNFLSHRFLPHAIAGEIGQALLYKTKSPYCWSLLPPNLEWLRRFSFSDLFEVEETEAVATNTLASIPALQGMDIDAVKLDTQGLELPILKASEEIVKRCILIETETGFTDNYLGETTFDQIAQYMRSMGFGLFDINTNHRVPRKNAYSGLSRNEEILWCEAIWLRDFSSRVSKATGAIPRAKALKALCIHAHHGCLSSGLEAATEFRARGVLSDQEYHDLSGDVSAWKLRGPERAKAGSRILRSLIHLIPRRYYPSITESLEVLRSIRHPFLP